MYKYNSNNAFLNRRNEKFLHRINVIPSARMPAQMLNANIIINPKINPFVGAKYPISELIKDIDNNRICSKVKLFILFYCPITNSLRQTIIIYNTIPSALYRKSIANCQLSTKYKTYISIYNKIGFSG